MFNQFFNNFKTLAKRTLIGADGTTYHRNGVVGYILDALESALGFFGLVAIGCTIVMLGHWVGIW